MVVLLEGGGGGGGGKPLYMYVLQPSVIKQGVLNVPCLKTFIIIIANDIIVSFFISPLAVGHQGGTKSQPNKYFWSRSQI